jgi:hypothetical protein
MALGQFTLYRTVLAAEQPERTLFLAIPEHVRAQIMSEPIGALLVGQDLVRFVGFDVEREVITGWTP